MDHKTGSRSGIARHSLWALAAPLAGLASRLTAVLSACDERETDSVYFIGVLSKRKFRTIHTEMLLYASGSSGACNGDNNCVCQYVQYVLVSANLCSGHSPLQEELEVLGDMALAHLCVVLFFFL